MVSFVVYPKVSEEELRKMAQETIQQVEAWFVKNPKRRVCRVEVWYGKHLSIKRKTISEQVNALLEETLKTN